MSTLTAVVCRVGRPASLEAIDSGLEALQALVGGYVEVVRIAPGVDLWINEDGPHLYPPNRLVDYQGLRAPIFGDFVIVGHDGHGNTCGLTGPQSLEWLDRASKWPASVWAILDHLREQQGDQQ